MEELRNLKVLDIRLQNRQMKSDIVFPIPNYKNGMDNDGKLHSGDAFVTKFSFQLSGFMTDVECDVNMAKFLHSQKAIESLFLDYILDHGFKEYIIPYSPRAPDFLPNLSTLGCPAELTGHLIHGRPVKSVQLIKYKETSEALHYLRESSAETGVKIMFLIFPDSSSPLRLLEQIAENAPHLEELTIYFHPEEILYGGALLSLTPALSHFKALKLFVLPPPRNSYSMLGVNTEVSIITQWAKEMPALRTVYLPSMQSYVSIAVCEECYNTEPSKVPHSDSEARMCTHLEEDSGRRRDLLRCWVPGGESEFR